MARRKAQESGAKDGACRREERHAETQTIALIWMDVGQQQRGNESTALQI
jgi:hypothetical protein